MVAMNVASNIDVGKALRFDRVAITCVFGDPRDLRSWSGAPANLANALERLGVSVEAIRPRMSRLAKWSIAACDMVAGLGRPLSSEQILRGLRSRRRLAAQVAEAARSLGARRMTILADPNAAPFYERMGARFVRNAPSDAIPGRTLPLYEYDLTSEGRS